jgi:RNA polymerase sigma factor (sigma-70 family)
MEKNKSGAIVASYYAKHYDELKAYVGARLQYAYETEDVVQNVFVRILKMDKMINEITLPCLVYTIAANLVRDYWRRKHIVEEYEHYLVKTPSGHASEDSVYSIREMEEILERGIARLTEKQQKVYRMNIYEGMPVSEICLKLNLKYKNVEHRLGIARKTVRDYVRRMYA